MAPRHCHGSARPVPGYGAWDTHRREALVLQAAGGPLMGMAMLYGHRVILHVVGNGDVRIDPCLKGWMNAAERPR